MKHARRKCHSGFLALSLLAGVSSAGLLIAQVSDDGTGEEAIVTEDEGTDILRRGAKPKRISGEERDRLKEENRIREQVGATIDRACEALSEQGDECDHAALKEQALQRLTGAAELYAAPLVCFDSMGNVTNDRSQCADQEIQSALFGVVGDEEEDAFEDESEDEGFGHEDFGGFYVPDDEIRGSMDESFGFHGGGLGDEELLPIISEALERLSGMLPHVQGNAQAVSKIQSAITWLSGLLRDENAGKEPPEDLDEQIRDRITGIMATLGGGSGRGRGPGGGFAPPDMSMIVSVMEKMMNDVLPWIIRTFEEEGVPISERSVNAYEQSRALFNELKGPCASGEIKACMKFQEIGDQLESSMRPDMEKAIFASGKYEIGLKIEQKIQEIMGDMMMPGMTGPGHGAPPGGMRPPPGYEDMMPPGFDPSQMRGMPSGGGFEEMMRQYGAPPGFGR